MPNRIFPPQDFHYTKKEADQSGRLIFLMIMATVIFVVIILRLFQLQIMRYQNYHDIANAQHYGAITLNAKRGEILTRDEHSGELSKLATNTTLDLVYVDPLVVQDKVDIAKKLAPLLFTKDDYDNCVANPDECSSEIIDVPELNSSAMVESAWDINPPNNQDETQNGSAAPGASTVNTQDQSGNSGNTGIKTYPEMVDSEAARILREISKTEVDFVVLKRDADPDLIANIVNEKLPGIFADTKRFIIYGDPTQIPESQLVSVSSRLAEILSEKSDDIQKQLARRNVRYVFLKNKLDPAISKQISDLNLKGVVLLPEHWRFYPEGSLAANVIGFLNNDKSGQYGIEGYFNDDLVGKQGTIYAEKDPSGRQITVGKSDIVNAEDGETIVLTIDRIVQKEVEGILADAVKTYKADSGQVIIMNPYTGAIIAMADYPSFDPNSYTDVYKMRKLNRGETVDKTVPLYILDEKNKYVQASDEQISNNDIQKYVYDNKFGPAVYKNKAVSEYYEPGSSFKPIVMAIALDAKEVEPTTWFMNNGPLQIDNFEIKNATGIYLGKTNMLDVIAYSLNTGMCWVSKKLGKELLYQYLKDFGFGEYTNIQLEGEAKGNLDFYNRWSKAQLLTTSFGQGIVMTPLQLITAWSALANGGKLMQPYIVDSIIKNGVVTQTEPQVIKRVISEETSSIITSMLIYSVQVGFAKAGSVPGYLIAGKTGTAQIAGKNGKYEVGDDGTTITSFAGYAPALDPKFVILVKLDRPRIGASTWGETTAAPIFKQITQYLLDYYNIQPSDK